MPVKEQFLNLLDVLQPTPSRVAAAMLHVTSVKDSLKKDFEVKNPLIIGSTARNTSIVGQSDVDLLVVLSRAEARHGKRLVSSTTFLGRVRNNLAGRFQRTRIRRDNQAVVIHFAQGTEPVDVVPAIFYEFRGDKKSPVYLIPDGNGDWLETAPQAHNAYLKKANTLAGSKLRKTVQLMKHWRHSRATSLCLSSIYLELLLASQSTCVGIKSYPMCFFESLLLLEKSQCRRLEDPVGIAGELFSSSTKPQRVSLLQAVSSSLKSAEKAILSEEMGRYDEAIRHWNTVFNRQFAP